MRTPYVTMVPYPYARKKKDHSQILMSMVLTKVASAMQYLHSRKTPIIHRDLKPQNVLLDGRSNAKVFFSTMV